MGIGELQSDCLERRSTTEKIGVRVDEKLWGMRSIG